MNGRELFEKYIAFKKLENDCDMSDFSSQVLKSRLLDYIEKLEHRTWTYIAYKPPEVSGHYFVMFWDSSEPITAYYGFERWYEIDAMNVKKDITDMVEAWMEIPEMPEVEK